MDRQCHVCKAMRPKAELLRVVRTPDGRFMLDPTGKAQGRGAYVCLSAACIAKGVKTRYLNRAFKCTVPDEVYQEVSRYASEL